MSIKEEFIMFDELKVLFGVKQIPSVLRCLNQNNIEYLLDFKQRPMVLRSNMTSAKKSDDVKHEEVALFT